MVRLLLCYRGKRGCVCRVILFSNPSMTVCVNVFVCWLKIVLVSVQCLFWVFTCALEVEALVEKSDRFIQFHSVQFCQKRLQGSNHFIIKQFFYTGRETLCSPHLHQGCTLSAHCYITEEGKMWATAYPQLHCRPSLDCNSMCKRWKEGNQALYFSPRCLKPATSSGWPLWHCSKVICCSFMLCSDLVLMSQTWAHFPFDVLRQAGWSRFHQSQDHSYD